MSAATDHLALAAVLIARPEAWTQGAMARDARGAEVEPLSVAASSWDMLGAVMKVASAASLMAIGEERGRLFQVTGAVALAVWNDARTHGEVLAALKAGAAS